MAHIISSDEIKKELPGYDPNDAGALHEESTRIADERLAEAIKTRAEKTVILMSGGSASGKSEYVSAYLKRRPVIISDGTSSKYERANKKITQALEHGKKVEIHAVWPEDFATSFEAFESRERKFDPKHFYRTHNKSRETLLKIAHEYPKISVTIVISNYDPNRQGQKMEFEFLEDKNRDKLIEYLGQKQYNEEQIKRAQGIL